MTEALRDLIEKVEASELPTPAMFRAVFAVPMQDMEYTVRPPLAREAYGGSLNAAKDLHETVLPGWRGIFTLTSPLSFASVFEVNENQSHTVGEHRTIDAKSDDPARAWLLAILYALRALSEAEG